jgi:hypothetical protein
MKANRQSSIDNRKYYSVMNRILTTIALSITVSLAASAQDLIGTTFTSLPQASYANPAKTPDSKWYIGMPGLASTNLYFTHTGFAYSDLIRKRDDDSLTIDIENALSQMKASNYMSFRMNMDLVNFGFGIKDNYFTFNATEKVIFQQTYPKDLFRFLFKGNAEFLGQTADLSGINLDVTHYREWGVGYSRKLLMDKLTVGVKAKYLQGLSNASTEKSDISLYTDENTFDLTAKADIKANTAGLAGLMDGEGFKAGDYLFNAKNSGFAVDLGANWEINDKFTVNASALDLGKINWKSQVRSYSTENAEFTFRGVDVAEFMNQEDSVDYMQELVDSLGEAFNIQEGSTAYSTELNPKFYVGGGWHFTPTSDLNLTASGEVFRGKMYPSLSVSIMQQVGNVMSVTAGYSIINGTANNVGLGMLFNFGPVQWYMVSDNVMGAFLPQHTQNLHLRTGINFVFGRKDAREKGPRGDLDDDGILNKADKCPTEAGEAKNGGCPDATKVEAPEDSE